MSRAALFPMTPFRPARRRGSAGSCRHEDRVFGLVGDLNSTAVGRGSRFRAFAGLRWPALVLLLLIGLSARAQDATVMDCTQAALEEALAGGGLITFECDGTITLTNTLLISTDTTLDATGHLVTISTVTTTSTDTDEVTVATNAVRLFEVEPDVSFELIHLRLADGRGTNGAAVFNNGGILTVTSCVFSNNQALGFNGRDGADGRDNNTTVSGSDGQNGRAGTAASGGAVYNTGWASFTSCSFLTNAAGGGIGGNGGIGGDGRYLGGDGGRGAGGGAGYGGAIFNGGDLFVTACTFNFNFVLGGEGGAGGLGGESAAFLGANGRGGAGGAAQGGAIYNATTGTVCVADSTFALNQTQGGDSADGGNGFVSGKAGQNGGQGAGGALFNRGTGMLLNSTFFANIANGGMAGSGSSGSFQGGRGGNGGAAWGGGVYNYRRMAATNCTFSDGGTIGGTNGVGGEGARAGKDGKFGVSRGANIANAKGTFYLKNCVIAYASPGTNGYGRFVNAGYNVSSDRSIVLRGSGSLVNTNPLLGVLADNGGPTHTLALQEGSPAINAADPNFCLPADQRGVARPQGARCDIGAYEYGLFLTAPTIVTQPQKIDVQVDGTVTFSVVASGDPPLLYQWRFSSGGTNFTELDGETDSTLVIAGAQDFDAGTYDVVVSNNSGSVTSEGASLTVLEPVTILAGPDDLDLPPGGTGMFSVIAEGDEPLTYQWLFNDEPILGATLDTLVVADVQFAQAGTYAVVVSNPFSSATSEATLTVTTAPIPPTITQQPMNATVATGEDASFFVAASGTPPLSFQWLFNGTNLAGETNPQLTITNAQLANVGNYHVVVANSADSIASNPVQLQVVDIAPTNIVVTPAGYVTNMGAQVTFTATASGSRPISFQWLFLEDVTMEIVGQTNATLVLENVMTENVGSYAVAVSNAFGLATSGPVTLLLSGASPIFAPTTFAPKAQP